MRAQAILFDKDGTLFDFAASWAGWAEAVLGRLAGGDRALAQAAGIAIGFDAETRRFAPDSVAIAGTPTEVTAELAPFFGHARGALEALLNEEAARAPQVPAVPLAPLLSQLRGLGVELGLATNDAEAPARAHLQAAGIADAFGFIAGHDSGFGAKPGPGMCLAFLAAAGVAPAQAVMVGDSLHDLMAGRAAGMQTVAVLTGLAPPEALAPLADAILPDIGHLPAWLGA